MPFNSPGVSTQQWGTGKSWLSCPLVYRFWLLTNVVSRVVPMVSTSALSAQ